MLVAGASLGSFSAPSFFWFGRRVGGIGPGGGGGGGSLLFSAMEVPLVLPMACGVVDDGPGVASPPRLLCVAKDADNEDDEEGGGGGGGRGRSGTVVSSR